MPPRPSRNLDQALLAAGRALFPERGCAAMSVREVAETAGVNLGMFHYHFKSREAFLRAMMQHGYEAMFATLSLEIARPADTASTLRYALRAIARFVRDNRRFLARLLADALSGEACAREFLRDNLPRHLTLLRALIARGQEEGVFAAIPLPQAMGVCAGALAMPILAGGAMIDSGALDAAAAKMLESTLLSNDALDERIDLALKAISSGAAPAAKRAKRAKRAKKARGNP
ncbi:MAG: TetR/AcrR family transcriptional regulator [Usitatibacter sp.]